MKRYLLWIAAGFLLAVAAVMYTTPGSWTHYRFATGRYDYAAEKEEVRSSIRLFSASLAGFYMTGGSLDGLNAFPAERMVKRRIFMDLNNLKMNGSLFIPDRDKTEFRDIRFLSPVHAVAVTDEDWFLAYQDLQTRKPLTTKKHNPVTFRYYLKKQWGKWIVLEFDVFSREETLPPAPVEKIVQW